MKIVAVCACPAGLMHTFMAAKNLKKEAKKVGDDIAVETQGASGIESQLTSSELGAADVVLLAIDTAISGMDRFEGKRVLQVGTAEVLRNARGVLDKAHKVAEGN